MCWSVCACVCVCVGVYALLPPSVWSGFDAHLNSQLASHVRLGQDAEPKDENYSPVLADGELEFGRKGFWGGM